VKWLIGLAGLLGLFGLWRWRMDEARLVLAQTIYGEARGEGAGGMSAVAAVIVNRAFIGGWWGDSVISVCKAPWQFSTWNEGDPNRPLIENLRPGANASFDLAWQIAGEAIGGTLGDVTGGATHYYAPGSINKPYWAVGANLTARIGGHDFFDGVT